MNEHRSLGQVAEQAAKIMCAGLAVALVVAGCNANELASTATDASEPVTQAQVDLTVHVCTSCHGFKGRSISPNFPILAGLQAGYIEAQLKAFRDHSRADRNARTYMWGMAAHSSDAMIHAVAIYFSCQQPGTGVPAAPAVMAAGEKIYRQGLPAEKIPSCQSCHGVHGHGLAVIPRLAGQHPEYLAKQLEYFASNERQNPIMRADAKDLTPAEIEAVSAYAAAQ